MLNQTTEPKSTLQELAEIRAAARDQAKHGGNEELPAGAAPVEPVASDTAPSPAPVAEVATPEPGVAPIAAPPEPKEIIKIGDREFTSQKEAFEYAEQLEREKLAAEAYNMGIQEALRATQKPVEPQPEENFEEKFYSNPKETLKEVQQKARDEAVAVIRAEQQREALWSQFFSENPDLAGHRSICEHVLQQNWDVLGNMKDIQKAMKILATKTRSVFQDYMEKQKPRVELPNKGGQVVSSGQHTAPVVTQAKKVDEALDFISEMKRLRKRT